MVLALETERQQGVEQEDGERGCPNCARIEEELQEFRVWNEFIEFEFSCAEVESDLVKSILTWVRARHLLRTDKKASLLELSEAAEKSWRGGVRC